MSALLSLIFAFPILTLALRLLADWGELRALDDAPPPSPPATAVETTENAGGDADPRTETECGGASPAAVFARSLL